jgi:hypothetical protein
MKRLIFTKSGGFVPPFSNPSADVQQTRSGLKKSGAARTILRVQGHFPDKRFAVSREGN